MDADGPPPSDTSFGPILMGVTTGLIFLVLLTTSLRVYIRVRNRALSWDDYLIIAATIFSIVRWSLQVVQVVEYGQGMHRIYLSEQDYVTNNRLGWWAQLCLFAGLATLKLSIMMLILRLKDTKALKRILYTFMAGLVIINLGIIAIFLAECKPVGYWQKNAVCWPTKVRIYATYVVLAYSILTDLVCSLLPLVVIWKINIPRKTKALVCSLMSLGLLATGFGIARAISLGTTEEDLSWTYAKSAFWGNLEFYLGIIAGNLSLSYQVYRRFFPSRGEIKSTRSSDPPSRSTGPDSAQQLSRKLRDPLGDLGLGGGTVVESRNRRSSSWGSARSWIPMGTGIRKKTEVWVRESDREEAGEGSWNRRNIAEAMV